MFKNWSKIAKYFDSNSEKSKKVLDKKVEEGTDRAVRDYYETFKKLEDYDKQKQEV